MQVATEERPLLWAIHSSTDGRPAMRGFARSEAEALRDLEALRETDGEHADKEYWLTPLTAEDVNNLERAGFLPAHA